MIGTLVNVAAVLFGGILGLIFNTKVPKRYIDIAFQGIGVFTLVLGISMSIPTKEPLFLVFSIIVGSIIGEFFDIDQKLNSLGEWLKKRVRSTNVHFTDGLITAFLLFCMGAMTIMGAIEEGMSGNTQLLMTKSVMDGFAAIALASTLGVGVLFSVVPLFLYQGGLTLLAGGLEVLMTDLMSGTQMDQMIVELSAVGGLLLIALGLNILELKKIKVSNMLPALVIILVFMGVFR